MNGKGKGKGDNVGKGKGSLTSKSSKRCESEEPSMAPSVDPAGVGSGSGGSDASGEIDQLDGSDESDLSGASSSPDELDEPAAAVCDAIEGGVEPSGDPKIEFSVIVTALDLTVVEQGEVMGELEKLDVIISLYVAGCEGRAKNLFEDLPSRLRSRELTTTVVDYVGLGDWENGKCFGFFAFVV
jgi:hypothetical protein